MTAPLPTICSKRQPPPDTSHKIHACDPPFLSLLGWTASLETELFSQTFFTVVLEVLLETKTRQTTSPGTTMALLPRSGPQRSGQSAGEMLGVTRRWLPPRKRGPRSRGGAAATERTSAQ